MFNWPDHRLKILFYEHATIKLYEESENAQ